MVTMGSSHLQLLIRPLKRIPTSTYTHQTHLLRPLQYLVVSREIGSYQSPLPLLDLAKNSSRFGG